MPPLLSIDEALARVLARARPLDAELVPVAAAAGRVLAEDVAARVDLPPFASSAMDGFAVRAADLPGSLPVVFRIAAGVPADRPLAPGEAMEISTGRRGARGSRRSRADRAKLSQLDNSVEIADSGSRPERTCVRPGATFVPATPCSRPARCSAPRRSARSPRRASPRSSVPARPTVVVLSTGTELRTPGDELGPGQIYESNGPMLAAAFEAAGAARRADRPDRRRRGGASRRRSSAGSPQTCWSARAASRSGRTTSCAGSSRELGVEEDFWGVAVRPGKAPGFRQPRRDARLRPAREPRLVARRRRAVRAAGAARAAGGRAPGAALRVGAARGGAARNAARDELVRARTRDDEGEPVLVPLTGQESHMIARAAAADALVLVPAGEGELSAGERSATCG